MTTPIPVPPYVPLLTHAIQVDTDTPNNTFGEWARTYGEIFEIYLFSKCSSCSLLSGYIVAYATRLCSIQHIADSTLFQRQIDYLGELSRVVRGCVQRPEVYESYRRCFTGNSKPRR